MSPSSSIVGSSDAEHLLRGAQAIRRFGTTHPILALAVEGIARELEAAKHAPAQLPLTDRFALARSLEEAAHISDAPELPTLARAIADDVLDIGATHAAEAAVLLADVAEPERSLRYVRLLMDRLKASPAPAAAPVDPSIAAGLRGAVQELLLTLYPRAIPG